MLKKLLLIMNFTFSFFLQAKTFQHELNNFSASLIYLEQAQSNIKKQDKRHSSEFYAQLKRAISDGWNKNFTSLHALGNQNLISAAKYMLSISDEALSHKERGNIKELVTNDIFKMLIIYKSIQSKHNPDKNLIITSFASGSAIAEKILLRTLKHDGYKSIHFYAIDPWIGTQDAIENFKEDEHLKPYNFYYFPDAKDYIEQIIQQKNELLDVCFTIGPIPYVSPIPLEEPNYCVKKNSFLFFPNYINELSIATANIKLIDRINNLLMNALNKDLNNLAAIKAKIIDSLDTRPDLQKRAFPYKKQYSCAKNLIINFLEITKLASKPEKDCIAYYFNSRDTVLFEKIHAQSIGKLYLNFVSQSSLILQDFRSLSNLINSGKLDLWTYNQETHQFEKKRI